MTGLLTACQDLMRRRRTTPDENRLYWERNDASERTDLILMRESLLECQDVPGCLDEPPFAAPSGSPSKKL